MEETSALEIKNLVKCFGEVRAVDGADLIVRRGSFLTLVGPSGCGKTTLLRLIAGFEKADGGEIYINGEEVSSLAPAERRVKTVYQKASLLPYASVISNITIALRARKTVKEKQTRKGIKKVMKRISRAEAVSVARRALELAGVEEKLFDRKASVLSGGEAGRVAIARALAFSPDLLLMDEPTSSLDALNRSELHRTLSSLRENTDVTVIYVTHDGADALALGDAMAVMDGGRIIQTGTPQEIYDNPVNATVAALTGECGVLKGIVRDGVADFAPFGSVPAERWEEGESVEAVVRLAAVKLRKGKNASVIDCVSQGTGYKLVLSVRCGTLAAYSPAPVAVGQSVGVKITAALRPMRAEKRNENVTKVNDK